MKSTVFVRPNLKMFLLGAILLVVVQHLITNGHSQHHFVLARSEDAKGGDGLKALSLFWVPRWIDRGGRRTENVKVTKVEEKPYGTLTHHEIIPQPRRQMRSGVPCAVPVEPAPKKEDPQA